MKAIRVTNVSKWFKVENKKFYALRNISLYIEEGQIFGILGPNGAGKTTLINLITGMLTPDKGTINLW